MSPEADARACGRFTRSLAGEAFQRYNKAAFIDYLAAMEAMRDHDELVRRWREIPGFMDVYQENAQ